VNTRHPETPWLSREYFENRAKVSPEELARYAGQHIAWSWDGTQVLASAADENELWDNLVAAGVDPRRVVFSYVDDL
jgi:hypothetical protein